MNSFSVEGEASSGIRDLRNLSWSSIDNDTSRDLDQIEYVEQMSNGGWKVLIGIADVDAFVPKQSAIDNHAAGQTTTVYTRIEVFPMLPEELQGIRYFRKTRSHAKLETCLFLSAATYTVGSIP